MINTEWQYCGDIHLREGGFYWREPDSATYADYVEIVQVTYAPWVWGDSQWYIERGSVYLPRDKRVTEALDTIGAQSPPTRLAQVQAMLAYWGVERESYNGTEIVQIGKHCEFDSMTEPSEPDTILHGNSSLRKYVESTL